jgi:putative DNA primase/helicase
MIEETQNIRDLRQWLCWRIEERDGKLTKVPYSPLTGEKASTSNPETWVGYSLAVEAYREHGYGGIGLVFSEDDPFCGVDLDGCLNPEAGEIEGWAREIIEELDSYTEISPSGKGVHVLVRATLPEGRNRKGRFEAYDRGRYFTVTGKHLAGTPQTIEVRQEALQSVVRRVFGEENTNGQTKPVAAPEPVDNGLSDSEVLQKALAASNGARFSRLWNGDTSGYGSPSEADLALCGMLAFWTGGDATRIDTLFRQSGLYRKKWDRKDYRNRTITQALSGKTEFYKAPKTVKLADGTEHMAEEKEERRNQADRLIGYALQDVQELFVDQHGAPHALIADEPVPLTSRCYSWLRRLMWEEEGRSVSGEYLKMAAGTLSAHAEFSGEVRELYTRAAWHEGVLYYELRPGKVMRVSPGGWTFEAKPPVLFRRYPNLKPLPDPQASGDPKRLWTYLNLKTERDRRLLLAYIATVPLPQIGRPILSASGPMGSGKTTAGRLVKRQWDPTTPETVRYDPRDFLQKASHCYIPMLDNLSALPDSASDTLCRLVTGEADSKRKLYTDDEDVIIELRRAVIINAINVPSDRGDVLDRSLVVELERIPDAKRMTEEELWERFEAERPELLGALFGVLAKAIARKPSLRLSRRPRLADWGEYAAAVYEEMGWGAEQFLSDWDEIVKVQNRSTLDGSPVAQAIIKFMEDRESFKGSSTELHKKLESIAEQIGVSIVRDKAWPKSARWLWRRIQEVVPLLVGVGIEASRERDEAGTIIALRRIPTDDASDASQDRERLDKLDTTGNTARDDARPNARIMSNASANASRNSAETASSGNAGSTGNRYGVFSGEANTPEQAEHIRRLVEEGTSETWARRTVLADSHPLDCDCEVCL